MEETKLLLYSICVLMWLTEQLSSTVDSNVHVSSSKQPNV